MGGTFQNKLENSIKIVCSETDEALIVEIDISIFLAFQELVGKDRFARAANARNHFNPSFIEQLLSVFQYAALHPSLLLDLDDFLLLFGDNLAKSIVRKSRSHC